MAVKIRLARRGRKKAPVYDIVVADARSPRDGKFIEKIGQYNPQSTPAGISLKNDRAVHWLMVGAQPTDTTRKILSVSGVMLQKHLQVGVEKGAITQEVADAKFAAWSSEKAEKRQSKIEKLSTGKEVIKKAAFDAEKKKRADMEAAQQPVVVVEAVAEEVVAEVTESVEETVAEVAASTEEVVAEVAASTEEVVAEVTASTEEVVAEVAASTEEVVAEVAASTEEVVAEVAASTEEVVAEVATSTEEVVAEVAASTEEVVAEVAASTEEVVAEA